MKKLITIALFALAVSTIHQNTFSMMVYDPSNIPGRIEFIHDNTDDGGIIFGFEPEIGKYVVFFPTESGRFISKTAQLEPDTNRLYYQKGRGFSSPRFYITKQY